MNEQIRRLMEQAVTSIDGQTFGKTYIPDEFTEKFAELIVRECANYMNSHMVGNIQVAYTVAKMKQKLLGVENEQITN